MHEREEFLLNNFNKGLEIFLNYPHDSDLQNNVTVWKKLSSDHEVDLYMLGWTHDALTNVWSYQPTNDL